MLLVVDEAVRREPELQLLGLVVCDRDLLAGARVLDDLAREELWARLARPGAERLDDLTSREREVLRRLVQAERIAQISSHLGIAEQTVRNHIGNIYSKLHIHTRIEIVRYISEIRYYLAHTEQTED